MPNIVRFDHFEVDLSAGQLSKRGLKISLREKSFQMLEALLEHPGQVVTREDLRRRLWHEEVFVDFDNNLNTAIARLREALGDSADHPRFIETLPKRGYRFLANVSELPRAREVTPAKRGKLVVLPLVNLSGDPAEEYFSDAMTDEIITEFARLAPQQLAVIARTTAMHYKGSQKDVTRIGRELGVDYVVEGGVRRLNGRVGINAQLIQVSDQTHLFAKKYDAALDDIFNMQRHVALDIAGRIGVAPVPDNIRAGVAVGGLAGRKPTEDLTAYNEYIQARYLMGTTAEGLAKVKEHLEKAIACDPEFALAYDALAEVYWYVGYFGFMRPREAFSVGIVHALRAIEIDNTRAETHALLGQFHKTVEYNWPEVQREMALALRLDPTSPLVRLRYAVSWLMPQGRMEEATAEVELALQSDPLSLFARTWRALMLLIWHQHERTLEAARQVLELDPAAQWAYIAIGSTYRDQGLFEKAIAAHRRAMEASGDLPSMMGWLGLTLGLSGNASEARALLERLYRKAAQGYVPPTSLAWIHLGLGEIDAAFEWLNRAVDECDQLLMPIKSYAFLDPIRADPRFDVLLHRMNLEP
ncbi:MAG: winged helix-turn-helix domain-containing protein [Acidobacteriia bacterium]|nr:winged helix-turn-helix domain-containing protein [Terriglobia bacterium]